MGESTVASSVGQTFTAAIEQAASSVSFGRSNSSGERKRRRYEAVVQFMLAYILERDGELDSFAKEFKLSRRSRLRSLTEYRDSATGDRYDHLIVDSGFLPVAIIEDKIDAGIAPSQLDRYARYLHGGPGRSDLIVIHPARRNLAAGVDTPRAKRVRVQFITWGELSRRMIDRTASPDRAALWEVLAEFAENVGTGDLSGLPAARPMVGRDTAGEVRDIILTGQTVASTLARGRLRELAFSMHPLNPRPWLQAGMTSIDRLRVGLELDTKSWPGRLDLGLRGPGKIYEYLPSKVGFFTDGKLSAAAQRRVAMLAELAEDFEQGRVEWRSSLPGWPVGRQPSDEAMDSIEVLAAVFQASSLRNPHRGGAIDGAKKFIEGPLGEWLGVRL